MTIKDIARETGFSVATVSMVLNNKNRRIPQVTVDSIKKTATEMNYRPNALAVALITNRTHTIGLIIPDNSNSFFASLSKNIEASARKSKYNVIYGNSDNKIQRDIEYFNLFVDRGVDGVIFAKSQAKTEAENDKLMQMIKESNIPVIFIDRNIGEYKNKSVVLNHKKGGYLATNYLLKLGHEKIGCVVGSLTLNSSKERLEGYKKAIEEYSIPFDESLIYEGDYDVESGVKALPLMIEKKVTGIFAFADMIACGIYKEARNRNISIPNDLSVVGFDNLFFSDILVPPLTTINQPISDMAQESVRKLIEMIEKTHKSCCENDSIFEPTLIIRESCKNIKKIEE